MVDSFNQKIKQDSSLNHEQGRLSKKHFSMELFYFNESLALHLHMYRRNAAYLKPRLLCSEILIVQTFRLTSMIDMIQRFLSL